MFYGRIAWWCGTDNTVFAIWDRHTNNGDMSRKRGAN